MDAHQKLIAVFLFFLLIMISAESTENTKSRSGRFGKDPTVETSFLPDRYSLTHIQSHLAPLFVLCLSYDFVSVSGRQRNKLSVRDCENCGFLSRRGYEVILISGFFCFFLTLFHTNNVLRQMLAMSFFSDEPLQITYSYWDGAGHRRTIQASKARSTYIFFVLDVSLLL